MASGLQPSVASARTVPRRRWLSTAADPTHLVEPDRAWIRIQRRAMACRFEITLDKRDARVVPAAHVALDLVDAIEAQLTVFRDTSELVHLNRSAATAPVPCDRSLFALLTRCAELSAATDGAFDITTTPLSRCWGFLLHASVTERHRDAIERVPFAHGVEVQLDSRLRERHARGIGREGDVAHADNRPRGRDLVG